MAASAPDDDRAYLCPSSNCEEGAILLGIVAPSGVVGYVSPQTRVGPTFVRAAEAFEGARPEQRFRFAGRCIEGGCAQWTGSRCGVVDRVTTAREEAEVELPEGSLPRCTIRPSCRWFAQSGAEACRVCPYVITDSREAVPVQ